MDSKGFTMKIMNDLVWIAIAITGLTLNVLSLIYLTWFLIYFQEPPLMILRFKRIIARLKTGVFNNRRAPIYLSHYQFDKVVQHMGGVDRSTLWSEYSYKGHPLLLKK